MVYFITDGELVKIGKANDPLQRLKSLQTGNAKSLIILFKMDGDYKLEALIHELFSDFRIRGEWFDLSETAVMRFESNISKYGGDYQKIYKYIDARVEHNRAISVWAPKITEYVFNKLRSFDKISSAGIMQDLDINMKIVKSVMVKFKISTFIQEHNEKVDKWRKKKAFVNKKIYEKNSNYKKRRANTSPLLY